MPIPRPSRAALVAALVFAVLAGAAAIAWEQSDRQVSDVGLYRVYGERIAHGEIPYRDFRVEYPPGALVVFATPALVTGDATGYAIALGALLAVVGALGLLLVDVALTLLGRDPRDRLVILAALAVSPVVLGALLLSRFDLLPATLVTGTIVALLARRHALAGVLLGTAIAVKLYPLVLVPIAGVWAVAHGRRQALLRLLIPSLALPALAYLPFVIASPGGVGWSLGHQASRPLQIESLGASLLLGAHHVLGLDLSWSSGHGSQNLDGALPDAVATASSLLSIAVIAAIWWSHARGPTGPDQLVRASAAAVLAFVALGKVLSPQFVVWLVLLVPLVGGRSGRAAAGLVAAACLLTVQWFPLRYWVLVKEFDPVASWLVLARDVALVAALVACAVPLSRAARGRGSPRSRSPGPSAGRT